MRSLSVIVLVHDCQDFVTARLASVERSLNFFYQSYPDSDRVESEVIVVEADSNPRSREAIAQFIQDRPRFRLLPQVASQGSVAAIKAGFQQASGELIFFCTDDHSFLPHHILVCATSLHDLAAAFSEAASSGKGIVPIAVQPLSADQYKLVLPTQRLDAVRTETRAATLTNLCVRRDCHAFLETFLQGLGQPETDMERLYHYWLENFFAVGEIGINTVEQAAATPELSRSQPVTLSNPSSLEASLFQLYQTYVTQVSQADHAISWELATYLLRTLQTLKPRSILDLGSGFSSLIARTYQATCDPQSQVTSVDDDAAWLERTKAFLQRHQLTTERCLTWQSFLDSQLFQATPSQAKVQPPQYDLILYDLGTMQTRAENLSQVVQLLDHQGCLIVDDVHFPAYALTVFEVVGQYRMRMQSLKPETLDRYGRYAVQLTYQ